MAKKPTKKVLGDFKLVAMTSLLLESSMKYRISLDNRLGIEGKANISRKIREGKEDKLIVRNVSAAPEVFEYAAVMLDQETKLVTLLGTQIKVLPPVFVGFMEETRGLNDKSFGRLLGAIGHPCWKTPMWHEDDPTGKKKRDDTPEQILVSGKTVPRSVSMLWQYCGVGSQERRKTGMTQEAAQALGNQNAGIILHVIAGNMVRLKNERYCDYYYDAKTSAALAHPDWKPGHVNNHGLRIIKKNLLKDLWVAVDSA